MSGFSGFWAGGVGRCGLWISGCRVEKGLGFRV